MPISRRTDPVSVRIGARVTVRYRIGSPTPDGPSVTDIIGTLECLAPLLIRPDGAPQAVHIPMDNVVVLKTLSATIVRNPDIRAFEQAAAAAFPGHTNEMIGGWLARAGDGITERSNTAVPLEPMASTSPVPLDDIHTFYAEHGLPTRLMVPDRIARPAASIPGQRGPEIIVMTKELDTPLNHSPGASGISISCDADPSDEWFSLYHFRGTNLPHRALTLMRTRIDGDMTFASLRVNGELAAITRATVTRGGRRLLLGLSAVEVAPEFRRQGLATALARAVMQWGHNRGAAACYLDVIESNAPGRALYEGLGFTEHHRHRSITVPRPAG